METTDKLVPVSLPNGARVRVEVTDLGGAGGFESAGFDAYKFDGVIAAVEGIASAVQTALEKVGPKKASVELGLELGVEAGQLTALLVKGTGKANLKIILHWEGDGAAPAAPPRV